MSIEVRPLNVLCNIQCHYCYQDPQRDAGLVDRSYDLVQIKKALELEGGPFTLFGGEPLLLPLADLEDLWRWGYERYKRNSLQSNGTLISAEHIRLFRQYKVNVGISLDGPGELNDVRWHSTLAKTRESTSKAEEAILTLCREGMPPSMIITLSQSNASSEKLPILIDWVRKLHSLGITKIRLHLLESETSVVRNRYGLSVAENISALTAFLHLSRDLPGLNIDLFTEMRQLLLGEDRKVGCIWTGCDPYTTRAVRGIEGQGQRSNCGRTNKDGIDFVKSSSAGYERYIALYQTPQASNGCNGCRFFLMCKGQCPGTAVDGDWRNRTEHCDVWKAIFELLESELLAAGSEPLSLSSKRRDVELAALTRWSQSKPVSLAHLVGLT